MRNNKWNSKLQLDPLRQGTDKVCVWDSGDCLHESEPMARSYGLVEAGPVLLQCIGASSPQDTRVVPWRARHS